MRPATHIQRTNRRERYRGLSIYDVALYAFSALLSLVRFFPKGKGRVETPERLSAQTDREFREWCRERAGAPGEWTIF